MSHSTDIISLAVSPTKTTGWITPLSEQVKVLSVSNYLTIHQLDLSEQVTVLSVSNYLTIHQLDISEQVKVLSVSFRGLFRRYCERTSGGQ